MAIHAPRGANESAIPRTMWQSHVNLLVYEYVKRTKRTKGATLKHNGLSSYAASSKNANEITVKINASHVFITPLGSSLFCVLGFSASIFRSIILFIPIAPDLPPTIATVIQNI